MTFPFSGSCLSFGSSVLLALPWLLFRDKIKLLCLFSLCCSVSAPCIALLLGWYSSMRRLRLACVSQQLFFCHRALCCHCSCPEFWKPFRASSFVQSFVCPLVHCLLPAATSVLYCFVLNCTAHCALGSLSRERPRWNVVGDRLVGKTPVWTHSALARGLRLGACCRLEGRDGWARQIDLHLWTDMC